MAFNFPNAPTNGQVYSPIPGLSYRWNGTLWETVSTVGTALPFNYIVNPAMVISQENGNNTRATDGYVIDQWYPSINTLTGTCGRVASVTTMGSKNRLRFTVSAIVASPPSGTYAAILQWFEGHRTAPLKYGFPQAEQCVLRFWVKAPAGNWSIAIRNSDNTRGYAALYNVSAGEANTLVEKVVVIPGDTTGPYGKWAANTNTHSMNIWFTFAQGGNTYAITSGTWADANVICALGMSNGWSALNTFEIADVGLYLDPYKTGIAPKWESPSEFKSLQDCQRYWYPCKDLKGLSGSGTYLVRGAARTPTPMRAPPAISIGTVGGNPCQVWDIGVVNTIATVVTYGSATHLECDCNTNVAMGANGYTCVQLTDYPGYLAVSARVI